MNEEIPETLHAPEGRNYRRRQHFTPSQVLEEVVLFGGHAETKSRHEQRAYVDDAFDRDLKQPLAGAPFLAEGLAPF